TRGGGRRTRQLHRLDDARRLAVAARDHGSLLSPGPVLWAARSRRASRHWTVLMAMTTSMHRPARTTEPLRPSRAAMTTTPRLPAAMNSTSSTVLAVRAHGQGARSTP